MVDACDAVARVPELLTPALTNPSPFTSNIYQQAESCDKVELWQTQVRGLTAYTIPKIDVLVSSIMRFQPNASCGWARRQRVTGLSARGRRFSRTTAMARRI